MVGRHAGFFGALIGAGLFCAGGALLDQSPQQQSLRNRLQTQQVPSALLDSGILGSLLQRADYVDEVPNDSTLYAPTLDNDEEPDPLIFRRKSRIGDALYEAHTKPESTFPDSSLALDDLDVGNWAVVSVAVDPDLLAQQLKDYTGKAEERAEVSFYRAGTLEERLRVGLRLHGGNSRRPGRPHSYRLHLRERYGDSALPSGFVFGGDLDPIRTLILRRILNLRFCSSLGYDIFRALGVDAPKTESVLFYLNGERQGIIAMTEHLSPKQLPSRIGHDNFLVFRRRGSSTKAGEIARDKLLMWALESEYHMTAKMASQYVDLDQFSRYILGIAFCHTHDWEQGAALLDLTSPGNTWRWMPWDLDRSFRSQQGQAAFDLILSSSTEKRESVPAILFRSLIECDPSYRASFSQLATECLNHRLTSAFLEKRATYYVNLPTKVGQRAKFDSFSVFFKEQRLAIMQALSQRFQQGAILTCRVERTEGIETVLIDGYVHSLPYEGLYLAGQTMRVKANPSTRDDALRWKINGEPEAVGPLQIVLTQDTVVTALLP